MKKTKLLVVYHEADFDGIYSRKVCEVWLPRLFGESPIGRYNVEVTTLGWDYGRPWTADVSSYEVIYLVDLAIPELLTTDISNKVVWIDHHKTAIEQYEKENVVGYRIDGVAACRLCWQWFTERPLPTLADYKERKVAEPYLLTLLGEHDIWDCRDPNAEALQYGLRALDSDKLALVDTEQLAMEDNSTPFNAGAHLTETLVLGRSVLRYAKQENAKYAASHAQTIHFEGLCFCAINLAKLGNSTLFEAALRPEHQACFGWRWNGTSVVVSLYHVQGHENLDLSEIAVRYGGGGHRGACGFRISLAKLGSILREL